MIFLKYGLALILCIVGSMQISQAIELPYCYETACYKASYNEETESMSIFVWKGENEILLTNTFKVLNVGDFRQFEHIQSISKDDLWVVIISISHRKAPLHPLPRLAQKVVALLLKV